MLIRTETWCKNSLNKI